MTGHRLQAVGTRPLHKTETLLIASAMARGVWVRQCSCRTLILGRTEVDLHRHFQDHLRAVKESAQ